MYGKWFGGEMRALFATQEMEHECFTLNPKTKVYEYLGNGFVRWRF